jgi:alpha-N-arabinofuranosidase
MEKVMEKNFENFESSGNMLKVALPPCSLVSLRIKLS